MERTNAERTKDPERLAALLDRQHLVVATWQMKRCGYSEWAARRAVRTREFDRIYRGVLTVAGTHLTFKGHCMAAALACGPDAVISHHAAAALWDLRPIPQTVIDVTAPTQHSVHGIRSHVSPVPQTYQTNIDAIPVTTLERTCLDYAEQATPRQLTAALETANRRDLLDLRKLRRVMEGSPGRRGLHPLTAVLTDMDSDPQWTQSPPEQEFLELIRATDLPRPKGNRLIEGHLVDFVWPAQRLIVEIDTYRFHTSRAAFESDRARDAHLQRHGWRVLRITARRLHTHPQSVVADVRQMLNQ
jgi:very-short-patch-repair endonuclease/predicted transcriptional regulator of viral defense system